MQPKSRFFSQKKKKKTLIMSNTPVHCWVDTSGYFLTEST